MREAEGERDVAQVEAPRPLTVASNSRSLLGNAPPSIGRHLASCRQIWSSLWWKGCHGHKSRPKVLTVELETQSVGSLNTARRSSVEGGAYDSTHLVAVKLECLSRCRAHSWDIVLVVIDNRNEKAGPDCVG